MYYTTVLRYFSKIYNSENQYAQHLKSRKHLDQVASGSTKQKPKTTVKKQPIPEEQKPKLEALSIFPKPDEAKEVVLHLQV